MYCPNCSTKIKDENAACPNCGMSIFAAANDVHLYEESTGGIYFQRKNWGRIVVSFVSGVLSLILFLVGLAFSGFFQLAGLAVAIIGLYFNRRYNKGVKSKLRTAGFVLSIIDTILNGLFTLAYLLLMILLFVVF